MCISKECSVAGAGVWSGDEWKWGLGWRREFRVRDTNDLNLLLNHLVCRKSSSNEADGWRWKSQIGGKYTVKSGYNILETRRRELDSGVKDLCKLIWCNLAPPKVKVNSWRILFRRIATKSELCKRGVSLPNAGTGCPLCDELQESIDHIFLECGKVYLLWRGVLKWLGVQAIMSNRVNENFIQFCFLAKGKKKRIFLASLWACSTWCIWKKRNEIVFNCGKWNHEKVLGEIKSHLWNWVKDWKIKDGVKLSFGLWWEDQLLDCI